MKTTVLANTVYCHPIQNYPSCETFPDYTFDIETQMIKMKNLNKAKNTCKPLVASMEMLPYNLPDTEESRNLLNINMLGCGSKEQNHAYNN